VPFLETGLPGMARRDGLAEGWHGALATAFAADPMLPGMIGLLPSPYASAALLLDVSEWLTGYVPFRGARSGAAGTPADRNVELRITPPFPLVDR
jgi:hypothetical protein